MSNRLRVTVCELCNEGGDFDRDWEGLATHVQSEGSDLVLLPEMIFSPWFASARCFDAEVWRSAVEMHDFWMGRLEELAPAAVLGSRPLDKNGRRVNEAFIWDERNGYRGVHTKAYLPDEENFWEASWYGRGDARFEAVGVSGIKIGFLVCTDIWFFEHARALGKQGTDIIAHPRATQRSNLDKWLAGSRAAAVVSGAFCISSNRINTEGRAPGCGGKGWIVDPDGELLAVTSNERPFLTMQLDMEWAREAKGTYPRYVVE